MLEITWAGETLRLYGERAVLWVRSATLILADPHFGKDAAFRHAGIPVPQAAFQETLDRLERLVRGTECRRLLILGDFFHARSGLTTPVLAAWSRWRSSRPDLPILLVRGNHDRSAGDPPAEWRIQTVSGPWLEPPFCFQHEPPPAGAPRGEHVLCGHVHPAVSLVDRSGSPQRWPCFLFEPHQALLPAFGAFTGARLVRPGAAARVFVVAEREVVEAH